MDTIKRPFKRGQYFLDTVRDLATSVTNTIRVCVCELRLSSFRRGKMADYIVCRQIEKKKQTLVAFAI